MKRFFFAHAILIMAIHISAQTNYRDMLVRSQRTYWAFTNSLCFPKWDIGQAGICFDSNGLYDKYEIPDNDTLSSYENFDTEFIVSHRTYKLENDTIFITAWSKETGNGIMPEAYKILYLTDQRLVLIQLKPNNTGGWEESLQPGCDGLIIQEFSYMKPQ